MEHHIIGREFAVKFGTLFEKLGFNIQSSANFIDLPASDAFMVAEERYRLSPQRPNIRYCLQSYA
jgi:hypothetical protein